MFVSISNYLLNWTWSSSSPHMNTINLHAHFQVCPILCLLDHKNQFADFLTVLITILINRKAPKPLDFSITCTVLWRYSPFVLYIQNQYVMSTQWKHFWTRIVHTVYLSLAGLLPLACFYIDNIVVTCWHKVTTKVRNTPFVTVFLRNSSQKWFVEAAESCRDAFCTS